MHLFRYVHAFRSILKDDAAGYFKGQSLLERASAPLRTHRKQAATKQSTPGAHRRASVNIIAWWLPCKHLAFGVNASRTLKSDLEHCRSKKNIVHSSEQRR